MGPGGGPGADENYVDWERRPDENFENYCTTRGHLLTWIYMKDKEAGFILDAKNKNSETQWTILSTLHCSGI